jgi:hypothetical protein
MRPNLAGHQPGFIVSAGPPRMRGLPGRRLCQAGACCDRCPGRDAWLDTLRSPGLPRRRRRPLVAVVSPLAARVHPRSALAGTESPDCQTPVRAAQKRAVCYPSIDCPNREPVGKAVRFQCSTGPTIPSSAGAPAMPLLPSHDGSGIRSAPRTWLPEVIGPSARHPRGPLRADHPSSRAGPFPRSRPAQGQ